MRPNRWKYADFKQDSVPDQKLEDQSLLNFTEFLEEDRIDAQLEMDSIVSHYRYRDQD